MIGERQCHTFQCMISLHLRKTSSPCKTGLTFHFLRARSCGLYTAHNTQKYKITTTVFLRICTCGNRHFNCHIYINAKLGPSISGKKTERQCLGNWCYGKYRPEREELTGMWITIYVCRRAFYF